MPHEITEQDLMAVSESLFAGRKIEAIKHYRRIAGIGLAEAKASVEKIEEDLRKAAPNEFKAPSPKGCGTSSAVLIAFAVFGIWELGKLLT